MRCTVVAAGN
jgi:hypothetical protein